MHNSLIELGQTRIFWVCKCGNEYEIIGTIASARHTKYRICPACLAVSNHRLMTTTITEIEE